MRNKILILLVSTLIFLTGCNVNGGNDDMLNYDFVNIEYDSVNIEDNVRLCFEENSTYSHEYDLIRRYYCLQFGTFADVELLNDEIKHLLENKTVDYFAIQNDTDAIIKTVAVRNGSIVGNTIVANKEMLSYVKNYNDILKLKNIEKSQVDGIIYSAGEEPHEFLLILTQVGDYVLYIGETIGSPKSVYLVPLDQFVIFSKKVIESTDPQAEGIGPTSEMLKDIKQYVINEQ